MRGTKDRAHPGEREGRPVPRVSRAWRAEIHRRLLAWYNVHRRDLPWRRTVDAYPVWVSEIMLQQTRVATVIPYFEAWLHRFPTVGALAAAPREALLKAWEGLGLYARVARMQETARTIVSEHGGMFPADPNALRQLPGIGPYMAGMITSIAYAVPAPAVDGNVRRVLCRLFDLPCPTPTELQRRAASLVTAERPGDFNQALIELGALVCLPQHPRCGACPAEAVCRARARGTQANRPRRERTKPLPHEDVGTAIVIDAAGRLLLARRPEGGQFSGMWEFPGARLGPGETPAEAALRAAASATGTGLMLRAGLGTIRHTVSHRAATYHVFRFVAAHDHRSPAGVVREPRAAYDGGTPAQVWASSGEIRSAYALPRIQQRIAALLD